VQRIIMIRIRTRQMAPSTAQRGNGHLSWCHDCTTTIYKL